MSVVESLDIHGGSYDTAPSCESDSLQDLYDRVDEAVERQMALVAAAFLNAAAAVFFYFAAAPLAACSFAVLAIASLVAKEAFTVLPPYLILSIDGGGVRGMIPAKIVSMIEEEAGIRIADRFDCLAGTSIGGVLALALAKTYSAAECLGFFREGVPQIFSRSVAWTVETLDGLAGPKYPVGGMEAFLDDKFGETLLSEAACDLVIPSYDLMRNRGVAFHTFSEEYRMADVAQATAAAPTYFPSKPLAHFNLVDGGIWATDPSILAYTLCAAHANLQGRPVFILSIGTGLLPEAPISAEESANWGLVQWAFRINDLMFAAMERMTETERRFLRHHENVHILRLQPRLEDASQEQLDNTDPQNLAALEDLARRYFEARLNEGLRKTLIEPLTKSPFPA